MCFLGVKKGKGLPGAASVGKNYAIMARVRGVGEGGRWLVWRNKCARIRAGVFRVNDPRSIGQGAAGSPVRVVGVFLVSGKGTTPT